MKSKHNNMNVLYLSFFCLLALGVLSQVNGGSSDATSNEKNIVKLLQNKVEEKITSYVQSRHVESNKQKHLILRRANKELSSLKYKRDSCSTNKREKIQVAKAALQNVGTCHVNISAEIQNLVSMVDNTINITMGLVYDISNITMGFTNCTAHSVKLQCLIDTLQALEDDLTKFFTTLFNLVEEIVTSALSLAIAILSCFQKQSLQQLNLQDTLLITCETGFLLT